MEKLLNQEIWGFQKLLMLIQFIVTPIVTVSLIASRGLYLLPKMTIFNVSQDLLGIFICSILFISCVKDRKNRTLRTACFAHLICITAFEMFLNSVTLMLPANEGGRIAILLLETIYQMLGVLMTVVFFVYICEISEDESLRTRKLKRFVHFGGIAVALIMLGNLYGRYFFYFDSNGIFIRTGKYSLLAIYPLVVNVVILAYLIKTKISSSEKRVLTTFITLPVIAIVVYFVTGVSLIYSAILCSLIFIYGNVFTAQEARLAKKETEVMRKENELLLVKQEQVRVETELNLASAIQTRVLPRVFPPFPGYKEFDIYATMHPAKEVGGDFYDFFMIDEDHVGIVIADVSGKGVPAALYMMISKAMIKNAALQGKTPSQVLEQVNRQLCDGDSEIEMFVTVWYGIYEISTGKVTASNAGHEYPVICKPGGKFELIKDKHGFVIGGMEMSRYRDYEIQLVPGSKLFIYTDGVPEANNDLQEFYGMERMLDALNKDCGADAQGVIKNVYEDIKDFANGADQFDDITMVTLQINDIGRN